MDGIAIGIIGRQGAGKDEVANIIAREFGYTHKKFASALKEITREFGFNTSREAKEREQYIYVNPNATFGSILDAFGKNLYDDAWYLLLDVLEPYRLVGGDGWLISPRRFEQLVGTEVGRKLRDSIWVDAVFDDSGDNKVISDVRFLDEAKACDALIYVTRDGAVGDSSHRSEELTEAIHAWFDAPWNLKDDEYADFARDRYFRQSNLVYLYNNYSTLDELVGPVKLCVETIVRGVQKRAGI